MNSIESMTGFGESQTNLPIQHFEGYALIARVRSVNSRFLDIKVRLPKIDQVMALEQLVRKKLSDHFKRGSIELNLSLTNNVDPESADVVSASLNLNAAKVYLSALTQIKELASKEFAKLPVQPVSLESVLKLPGVLNEQEIAPVLDDAAVAAFNTTALKCVEEAILKAKEQRQHEGNSLRVHLSEILDQIKEHSDSITEMLPHERETVEKKLQEKIEKTLELFKQSESMAKPEFQNRLKEEASFYLDRRDVEEEIVRLAHHLEHFTSFLYKNSGSGKQLEFTLQEMFREINTLGNKIQSTKISTHVIAIKSLLEKLKEQVANVE